MAAAPTINRSTKMLEFINYRMRVTVADDKAIVGTLLAFDGFMNLVLADAQEFRKLRKKRTAGQAQDPILNNPEEMRTLGLVLLRGESIVSVQVEAPPKKKKQPVTSGTSAAAGVVAASAAAAAAGGIAVGRGAPIELVAAAPPAPFIGRGRGMPPAGFAGGGMGMPQPGYGHVGGFDGMGGRGRGMPR